jgi:hypothetical protein
MQNIGPDQLKLRQLLGHTAHVIISAKYPGPITVECEAIGEYISRCQAAESRQPVCPRMPVAVISNTLMRSAGPRDGGRRNCNLMSPAGRSDNKEAMKKPHSFECGFSLQRQSRRLTMPV